MTTPWHMARVASRRELPKPRKMMGPVGPESFKRPADGDNWCDAVRELGIDANKLRAEACIDCGFHVCSCTPKPIPTRKHPNGCPCAGCIPSVSASTARSDDWIVPMGVPLPRTMAGRMEMYLALSEHSDLTLDGLRAILDSPIRFGE